MPNLYQHLQVEQDASLDAIKQRILDRFLEVDSKHGHDDSTQRYAILAEAHLMIFCYETLCDPVKKAAYDANLQDYRLEPDENHLNETKLVPKPALLMTDHICQKLSFLGNKYYFGAKTLASYPDRVKITKDKETTTDGKIRLLGAKYITQHVSNKFPVTFTANIFVELFVKHPHMKDLYNLVSGQMDPEARKALKSQIGGNSAITLLHKYFSEHKFRNIRWLGDAMALLKAKGLESHANTRLLIHGSRNLFQRIDIHALSGLINQFPTIPADFFDPSLQAWPADMQKLSKCIDNMFNHGLRILLKNNISDTSPAAESERQKALFAISMAVKSKQHLLEFMAKPVAQQQSELPQFKTEFAARLDQEDAGKDWALGKHRQAWKVIVANTLLALTGIGLLAITINLAIHHRFFGQRTKRQELRDVTEKVLDKGFQAQM